MAKLLASFVRQALKKYLTQMISNVSSSALYHTSAEWTQAPADSSISTMVTCLFTDLPSAKLSIFI